MNNEELLTRIEALEKWKKEREAQQISFPLDRQSVDILNKDFVRVFDEIIYEIVGASSHMASAFLAIQDGKVFDFPVSLVRYTVDASSDVFTIIDKTPGNKVGDGQEIIFSVDETYTGAAGPTGITVATPSFFVRDTATDGYSFKVAATAGGAAINITDAGTGKQFFTKI